MPRQQWMEARRLDGIGVGAGPGGRGEAFITGAITQSECGAVMKYITLHTKLPW